MRVIRHTHPCGAPGYEPLDLISNIALTGEEIDIARAEGNPAPALLDISNWEEQAELLELPKDKPAFPLTTAVLNTWPGVLVRYVCDYGALSDALDHALAQRSPNFRRS